MEVRKELLIDEVAQVVAGEGEVVVDLSVPAFRRSPFLPAIRLVEDIGIVLSMERASRALSLEAVELFEKEQPRSLLGVIQLGRAAGLFAENVVDVPKSLFKHIRRR